MTDEIPILLCGDMNSAQDSSMFAFMDGRPIKPYRKVRTKDKHLYEVITEDIKTKNLVLPGKFVSSYSKFPHHNPNKNKTVYKFPEFTVYSKDN